MSLPLSRLAMTIVEEFSAGSTVKLSALNLRNEIKCSGVT